LPVAILSYKFDRNCQQFCCSILAIDRHERIFIGLIYPNKSCVYLRTCRLYKSALMSKNIAIQIAIVAKDLNPYKLDFRISYDLRKIRLDFVGLKLSRLKVWVLTPN
jgi:hypothetical protein